MPGVRIIVALFLHDMRQHASKTGGTADSMFASIVTGEVPGAPMWLGYPNCNGGDPQVLYVRPLHITRQ